MPQGSQSSQINKAKWRQTLDLRRILLSDPSTDKCWGPNQSTSRIQNKTRTPISRLIGFSGRTGKVSLADLGYNDFGIDEGWEVRVFETLWLHRTCVWAVRVCLYV